MTSETEAIKKEDPPAGKEADPPAEKKGEDEAEILKAVAERLRFFFSDANVRQDYFIRKLLMPDDPEENKDCSVSVEALLRFNTIKKHTEDPEVVVKAVKELLSEKLEVKDEGKAIARVKPFTKELLNENIPLSLYVKNLPTKEVEGNHGRKNVQYDITMGDIRKLFESYGEVAIVKMRFKSSAYSKDDDHTDDIKTEVDGGAKKPRRRYPLQSCMVEFENVEAHDKASEDVLTIKGGEKVEPKRKLEVGEKTLEVMELKEYVESLKSRKRDRDDGDGEKTDAAAEFTIDWKPGCVVSLKGLPEACDREAITEAVKTGLEISQDEFKEKRVYVDYSRGQKDGAIRFHEPELASKMVEKLKSGDAKICDTKVDETSLLEGDGEKKYWDDFIAFKQKQMRHRSEERKHKHNKRRRGPNQRYETRQS